MLRLTEKANHIYTFKKKANCQKKGGRSASSAGCSDGPPNSFLFRSGCREELDSPPARRPTPRLHVAPIPLSRSLCNKKCGRCGSRNGRVAAFAGGAGVASAAAAHCHQGYQGGQHSHVATSTPKVDVMDGKRLLLAVPKKGRMNATIIDMLNGAGFDYKRPDRIDIAHCRDLPISIVFLPAADIAT